MLENQAARCLRAASLKDPAGAALQCSTDAVPRSFLVIHDQDVMHAANLYACLVASMRYPLASGNVTSNRVPPLAEIGLTQVTSPPKSITRRCTTAKPKPVPFCLVVKKGINTFD